VTYTSFNMAASIGEGAATLSYDYDTEHKRISQAAPEGTIVYISYAASGITVERFIAGVSQWNDYLYADGRMVAVHFAQDGGTTYLRYFVADHLGSIAVLGDETAGVVERDSYDAWGQRRNPRRYRRHGPHHLVDHAPSPASSTSAMSASSTSTPVSTIPHRPVPIGRFGH
jgi:YD repeat-containing protein